MKRVTVLFDDDDLYRSVKAEAAREGRTVKDVVAEALRGWLRRQRDRISPEEAEQRGRAIEALGRISIQVPAGYVSDLLEEIRNERS
jgi:hypothetical protein